jgi:hypothetical protein
VNASLLPSFSRGSTSCTVSTFGVVLPRAAISDTFVVGTPSIENVIIVRATFGSTGPENVTCIVALWPAGSSSTGAQPRNLNVGVLNE